MAGPLVGIRVLDLSRFVAGPYCSTLLSDLGAEVIKVESSQGDDVRTFGPFYKDTDFSLYYNSLNRNKKGMAVNFRSPEGRKILQRLAAKCDVILENFRVGTLEKMGLGDEELKKINPNIIVTSVSGFGQTGPFSKRIAFDPVPQAMSGVMDMTGRPDGDPTLVGFVLSDIMGAVFATVGTLAALYHKVNTGEGQHVDISMLDNLIAIMAALGHIPGALVNGVGPTRRGNRDPSTAPSNTFRTKDGYVFIHVGTDPHFSKFCKMIGRNDLLSENKYKYNWQRVADVEFVEKLVADYVADKTTSEVEEIFDKAGLICGAVASIRTVSQSPQIAARKLIEYIPSSIGTELPVVVINVKLSRTPGKITRPAPKLGEHNIEICQNLLGFTQGEIKEMQEKGII